MSKLYAGDVTPKEAWEILNSDVNSALVDVRTKAEWHYVGVADLSTVSKAPILVELRTLPNMEKNTNFARELAMRIADKNTKIFFLCHLGGRSKEAAMEIAKLGYDNCYNISGGFVGELDEHSHRGQISGWKASQLPWVQD